MAYAAPHLGEAPTNGAVLKIYNDEPVDYTTTTAATSTSDRAPGNGLVIASGPNPDNETYTVTFKPGAGTWTALGVEVVQDESLPGIRVARGADRVVITEVEADVGRPHASRSRAGASNLSSPAPEYPPDAAFDGDPKTGWAEATYNENPQVRSGAAIFASPCAPRPARS